MMKNREAIENKYKWKLEDIYPNIEAWEADYNTVKQVIPTLNKFRDTLLSSADSLYTSLSEMDKYSHLCEKLYVYARMKRDEDNTHSVAQSLTDRAHSLNVEFSSALSYVNPMLTEAEPKTLIKYIEQNEKLKEEYDFMLHEIIRAKKHILSEPEENILSKMGEFSSASKEIFTMLNNADLKFGSLTDESGELLQITHGNYFLFLQSRDEKIRKKAYKTYYKGFKSMINTIGSAYSNSVKKDIFYAKVRGYDSALSKALFGDNVPVSLYKNLITQVNDNLHILHEYISVRKKLLNLKKIHMYDLFAPLVDMPKKEYTYEQGVKHNLDALAPLGADYISNLETAFAQNWVDVYETPAKTSGAYSWGTYGVHPYVLLNHRSDLNSIFTLAHEMGHALHTYYSNQALPYSKAGYTIFVAEVASTVNELLLINHLLLNETDKNIKKYLLSYYLDQFRTTVFRQTMFAEFEMITHELGEQGIPLTTDELSQKYSELNSRYYGNEMVYDDDIAIEWARIPHFYNAFYVYKYATGFSCAVAIVKDILASGESAKKRYLEFLSSGGSNHPLELLQIAGVDLASGEPVKKCMQEFADVLYAFKNV